MILVPDDYMAWEYNLAALMSSHKPAKVYMGVLSICV